MPAAQIRVNAVVGSDDDVPINTLVQLDNVDVGGEISYKWTILDQPIGTADALSSTTIENPTFTPKKEGTYLLELIVNESLADEKEDQVIVAVRHLKTLERAPAAGETTENGVRGWAAAANSQFSLLESLQSNPSVIVGVAGAAGIVRGDAVRPSAMSTIKSGLPGEETIPTFIEIVPGTTALWSHIWGVCEGGVDGSAAPASGDLIVVRVLGILPFLVDLTTPAVGDPIYVTTAGVLTNVKPTTAGASRRVIAHVIALGGGGDDATIMVYGIPSGILDEAGDIDWAESGNVQSGAGGHRQRLEWGQIDIAASQTAVKMKRGPFGDVTYFLNPKDGSALSLVVDLSANAAGDSVSVELFIADVASGMITTVASGQRSAFEQRRKDQIAFAAEDTFDLRITTSGSWTGTTVDVVATLEFED